MPVALALIVSDLHISRRVVNLLYCSQTPGQLLEAAAEVHSISNSLPAEPLSRASISLALVPDAESTHPAAKADTRKESLASGGSIVRALESIFVLQSSQSVFIQYLAA